MSVPPLFVIVNTTRANPWYAFYARSSIETAMGLYRDLGGATHLYIREDGINRGERLHFPYESHSPFDLGNPLRIHAHDAGAASRGEPTKSVRGRQVGKVASQNVLIEAVIHEHSPPDDALFLLVDDDISLRALDVMAKMLGKFAEASRSRADLGAVSLRPVFLPNYTLDPRVRPTAIQRDTAIVSNEILDRLTDFERVFRATKRGPFAIGAFTMFAHKALVQYGLISAQVNQGFSAAEDLDKAARLIGVGFDIEGIEGPGGCVFTPTANSPAMQFVQLSRWVVDLVHAQRQLSAALEASGKEPLIEHLDLYLSLLMRTQLWKQQAPHLTQFEQRRRGFRPHCTAEQGMQWMKETVTVLEKGAEKLSRSDEMTARRLGVPLAPACQMPSTPNIPLI